MREIGGGRAAVGQAASTRQMARFESDILESAHNLVVLTYLPGQWIDAVHDAQPPKWIALDTDSSISPTHGDQEGTAWNGHLGCKCHYQLFVFNHLGDLERCAPRKGNVHSANRWTNHGSPIDKQWTHLVGHSFNIELD